MALPFVQFTADSETALGCSSYIASAALAGELVNDASSDLPGSILVVARVAHSVAEQLSGRILFGVQREAVAGEFAQVGAAFGIDSAKLGGPLSSLFLKMLLTKLLEIISQNILPQACPCDEECTNDDCCDETPATTESAEVVTETSDAGTREDS